MSRRIEDLIPEMQVLAKAFAEKMVDAGIRFCFTCTYRSQDEQDALYAIGRTMPGSKVTWAPISKHTSRTAFDIAILKDGKPCWDIKVNVNANDVPDYEEAGIIGESVGLVWGGRFSHADLPHYQLPEQKED